MTPQELSTLEEIKLMQRATFNLLVEVMGQVSGRTVKSVFVLKDSMLHEFKGDTSLIYLSDAPKSSYHLPS